MQPKGASERGQERQDLARLTALRSCAGLARCLRSVGRVAGSGKFWDELRRAGIGREQSYANGNCRLTAVIHDCLLSGVPALILISSAKGRHHAARAGAYRIQNWGDAREGVPEFVFDHRLRW